LWVRAPAAVDAHDAGVETRTRFVLLVEWDSVQAHDGFRSSERFGQWRGLVVPHFAHPPQVERFAAVGDSAA